MIITLVVMIITSSARRGLRKVSSAVRQKNSGEVTLRDCLRLFTKEDVLDGEERPVRGFTCLHRDDIIHGLQKQHLTAHTSSASVSDVQQMQGQKKMHQEVQHSEVPSDSCSPYPFLTLVDHVVDTSMLFHCFSFSPSSSEFFTLTG